MSRFKAVLLDFGGVLYRTPDSRSMLRWLRLFGVRDLGPMVMLNTSPLESQWVSDVWTGKISEEGLWEDLRRSWGMHPRLMAWLRRSGYHPRRLDKPLVTYLSALRPRFRTAILTNAGTSFRETFGAGFRLEGLVDHLIISAEESLAKPDPQIYHLAAERLGVRPEEALFVDDREENVMGAQSAGMEAHLYESGARTIAWLTEMLAQGH